MTVLMPVAMPTSDCGTASTIRFAIAANANVMPAPIRMPATTSSHGWSWANVLHHERERDQHRADREHRAEADPLREPGRDRAGHNWASAVGTISSPAWVTVKPKP